MLPLAVASIVSSPAAGLLARRIRARTVAALASSVSLTGLLLLLVVIDVDTPYWLLATAVVVIGLGSGGFIPANPAGPRPAAARRSWWRTRSTGTPPGSVPRPPPTAG